MKELIPVIIAILIAVISASNKKKKQAQNQPHKPAKSPWEDIYDNWDIKPQKPAETHVSQTHASQTSVPQVRQTLHPASLETIEKEGHSLETAYSNHNANSTVHKPKQKEQVQHKMTSSAIKEEEITNERNAFDSIFEGGFDPRMGIIYAEIMNPKYKEF